MRRFLAIKTEQTELDVGCNADGSLGTTSTSLMKELTHEYGGPAQFLWKHFAKDSNGDLSDINKEALP